MRLTHLLTGAVAMTALALPAIAQSSPIITRTYPFPGARAFSVFGEDQPRAAIGVTTSSGANARDTLGVLVSMVYPGSPAEKAGIEEGNRIASINGVSLKLAPADVGDYQMAGVMTRRLTRELDRLRPGDDVDLRVYASGQTKSIKIKTVDPSDLYHRGGVAREDDPAALGLSLALTGSARDTLGVFVMTVDGNGPAAKAGIEEGNRIASINGVDVRARHTDDDDFAVRAAGVRRLEREIAKLRPGEDAELRVYSGGQQRTVKVKAMRASDLPRRHRSMTIIGGDRLVIPPFDDLKIDIDGARMRDDVRRTVERAMDGAGKG